MKKNQGFTLIELMIVIAIIAILMAYAIPAYRDYTVRAKAGECLSIMSAAKQAVSESYQTNGVWPTTNDEAYMPDASEITGENVLSVGVGSAGVLTCTFNTEDNTLSGNTVILTPSIPSGSTSIHWACDASSLDQQYRPKGC